jgi:outer membrane protein TolC
VTPAMRISLLTLILFVAVPAIRAQDTVRVSLPEFVAAAMEQAPVRPLSALRIDLAENRYREARLSRFVPRLELTTAHGLVPGVRSTSPAFDYPSDQLYLDPSLRNDWNDWGVFTRAEITTLQPIYTWGALRNAIEAARHGADIARYDHEIESGRLELQLVELYQSRLLAIELKRLIDEARTDFRKAEEKLTELLEAGDEAVSDADLFKFNLFREEFEGRSREADETLRFLDAAWRLALGMDGRDPVVVMPADTYLVPADTTILPFALYEEQAMRQRPELRKAHAAAEAARHGLQAANAQRYPHVFFAFSASYAKTPNRPRQANPFIVNNANFESIRYGIGIRQNLNFGMMRNSADRSRIQLEQARQARSAAETGIRLELLETYRTASIALSRYRQVTVQLQISNEWLRLEQINYDYDIGEIKDLVDAVQRNLELKALEKQRAFEWNVQVGRLSAKSGASVVNLNRTQP